MSPPENRYSPSTKGASAQPMPLNDCERLRREVAVSCGPSSVAYGLAEVSRKVRPMPMIKRHAKNAGSVPMAAPG